MRGYVTITPKKDLTTPRDGAFLQAVTRIMEREMEDLMARLTGPTLEGMVKQANETHQPGDQRQCRP